MGDIVLSNGVSIPSICFGTGIVHTYKHDDESLVNYLRYIARNAVKNKKQFRRDCQINKNIITCMNTGINMFDTSSAYYDAEVELGRSLKKYKRDKYFIVTKASNSDQYSQDLKRAMERTLRNLGLEYIDLYLLHWPVKDHWLDSWKQIEELYLEGTCRSIGVCNCNIHHLEELRQVARVIPMVNQIECHPLFTQNDLRNYCSQNNIRIMAYTSTARMDERLKKTALVPIAKRYNKTVSQVILRWHQQIGNIPIFNSISKAHIIENSHINDFSLTEEEIADILNININSRLRYDPDNCDFRQL